jgi:hypothetical protein
MLAATRQRVLDSLAPDAVVLDVGGWADPFGRADWVIDLMPYESRGLYEQEGWVAPRGEAERFSRETWIERDLCDREPYPFADKQIDFAICSHTLEDLRDPLWVCSELIRIAKAGYIEVPSRLEEQSWGVNGPFAGWSHHRWLIDVSDGRIDFVSKLHALHSREDWYFPTAFWERLGEEERIQSLWWEGSFACRERVMFDDEQVDEYLGSFVSRERAARAPLPPAGRRRFMSMVRRAVGGSMARSRR